MLHTFLVYSLKALQFLFVDSFWAITVGILLVLAVATVATLRERAAQPRPASVYLFPLLLLVAFPIAIAIGVIFQAPSPSSPNHAGHVMLKSLVILSALFAIYCVYRAKGIRSFATVLVIAELWLVLAAALVANSLVAPWWFGHE